MTYLKQILIKQEGLCLDCYLDTKGYHTVGVGHRVKSITKKQAIDILDSDIQIARQQAFSSFKWMPQLSRVRQDVIINMIFNLGLRGLKNFKRMMIAMRRQDHLEASIEMLDSKWAKKQVKSRAKVLAKMMRLNRRPNA